MRCEINVEQLRLVFIGLGVALRLSDRLNEDVVYEMIDLAGASKDEFRQCYASFDLFVSKILELNASIDLQNRNDPII
jgi:hypothetical protein